VVVKICGITTADDAIAAAAAGATAVGFNFYPSSPRYVRPEQAREIARLLPPHVLKVGVFVDEPAAGVAEVIRLAGLDVVQLHGGEYPAGARIWAAFQAGGPGLSEALADTRVEAFLVDTPSRNLRGGTGRTFDWSLAAGLPGRIVLAGGLDDENVREAIRTARPWGVDACSRLECVPGRKDHEKMRRFVQAALIEES
jgi:phosphoribosylanthranilate isomerase